MQVNLLKAAVLICCTFSVASCGGQKVNSGRNVQFDGQQFNSKTTKGDDRESFSIVVRDVSKSLDGAREAGRYEATKYCIRNYGTSDVIWSHGPDDADEALMITNNDISFSGRCKGW